jgi:hypothetical protein
MDKEQTEQFLRKIVADPDYRKRVEDNPVAALRELGIELDPNEDPTKKEIPKPVQLPPNQEIESFLAGAKTKHPLCLAHHHLLAILDWQRH